MPFPSFFRKKTPNDYWTDINDEPAQSFADKARKLGSSALGGLATVWNKGKDAVNNIPLVRTLRDKQHTRDWDTAIKGSMANGEKGILPAIHRFRGRAAARRMQRYNARQNRG